MGKATKFMTYFRGLRIPEVCLMTGFFMVAALFTIKQVDVTTLLRLIIIWGAIFLLILSIYAFNAWSGKMADRQNRRLASLGEMGSRYYGMVTIISLAGALVLGALINRQVVLVIAALAVLWSLYSAPRFGLKHIAFAGTALHFFAQIVHFNLVWTVFAPLSLVSFLWSVFFAILFAGGHWVHEVIDFEADRSAGIKTAAVKFGPRKIFQASGIVFLFNTVYLCFLTWAHPDFLFPGLFFSAAALAHTIYFFVLQKKWLASAAQLRRYQTGYRLFYLLAGLGYLLFLVLSI